MNVENEISAINKKLDWLRHRAQVSGMVEKFMLASMHDALAAMPEPMSVRAALLDCADAVISSHETTDVALDSAIQEFQTLVSRYLVDSE